MTLAVSCFTDSCNNVEMTKHHQHYKSFIDTHISVYDSVCTSLVHKPSHVSHAKTQCEMLKSMVSPGYMRLLCILYVPGEFVQ